MNNDEIKSEMMGLAEMRVNGIIRNPESYRVKTREDEIFFNDVLNRCRDEAVFYLRVLRDLDPDLDQLDREILDSARERIEGKGKLSITEQ